MVLPHIQQPTRYTGHVVGNECKRARALSAENHLNDHRRWYIHLAQNTVLKVKLHMTVYHTHRTNASI